MTALLLAIGHSPTSPFQPYIKKTTYHATQVTSTVDRGKQDAAMVSIFIDGHDLASISKSDLNFLHVLNFSEQILQWMDNLANNGIAHRNIKPENFIVQNSGTLFLIGLESDHCESKKHFGTSGYRAPEVILQNQCDYLLSDLYSSGVAISQLLTFDLKKWNDRDNFILAIKKDGIITEDTLDTLKTKVENSFSESSEKFIGKIIEAYNHDPDFSRCKDALIPPLLEIFDVVVGLTRFNPDERLKLKEALKKIKSIKNKITKIYSPGSDSAKEQTGDSSNLSTTETSVTYFDFFAKEAELLRTIDAPTLSR
jgi:serine/threonine protein kinase